MHRAFVQARNLALKGDCQQLYDLADTFEVLPELMARWDESTLGQIRGILAEYEATHQQSGYEYLTLLDRDINCAMPIYVAVANAPDSVDEKALFRFVETSPEDFRSYAFAPAPNGHSRKAAFDYVLLLDAAGSAASIAALLWMAFDKFIAPKLSRTAQDEGAHIHIGIRKPDGTAVEFRIDNLQADKEVVISDFVATVSQWYETPGAVEAAAKVEAEIKHSGMWIRRR
jgi:hypothetical protein